MPSISSREPEINHIPAAPPNQSYFKALTGVRAIAAYLVFFHHFNFLAYFKSHPLGSFLFDIVDEWHIGVTIFFVLSGFLIGYRYSELRDFSFRNYLVNRVARIYPMYFLVTIVTFGAIFYTEGEFDFKIFLINLTFIKGFFEPYKFTGIAQGWSLTVEETFYFLAPILFLLINRSKIWFLLGPLLLSLLGSALVLWFSKHIYLGFFSSFDFLFNYTFFGRASEFFLGIFLAYFFKNPKTSLPRLSYTTLGIVGISVSLVLLVCQRVPGLYGIQTNAGKLVNSVLLPAIGILPLFWGLLKEKTWLSDFLSSRLMVLLGKSSYIFYLIHLRPLYDLLEYWNLSNPAFVFLVANLLSIALFLLVEEPLNHKIRSTFSKSRKT